MSNSGQSPGIAGGLPKGNYCPVLVGIIGGARWGRAQIGKPFLQHHGDLLPSVEATAVALAHGWQNSAVCHRQA